MHEHSTVKASAHLSAYSTSHFGHDRSLQVRISLMRRFISHFWFLSGGEDPIVGRKLVFARELSTRLPA